MADSTYILYGSYASYYTAKTRSYLRKKGIAFVERLPSAPRFREHVRPTNRSHRIPQLEAPDGTVLQDTVTILDYLEARFPELPAIPATPRQRLAVHLMELLGSEGLIRLAWQHRWYFPDENAFFVKMDFGRSFRPQGSDEDLMHYGNLIAERMMGGGELNVSDETRTALDADYVALLELLETHFIEHPYMLGGHPSAADYALMGALFAHMGRDPAGLRVMQANAARVFRWVEHMNTPEIQSPEFADREIAYPSDDTLPPTFVDLLKHLLAAYGESFEWNALAWASAVASGNVQPGEAVSESEDQPVLSPVPVALDGQTREVACNVHQVWVMQRALSYYQGLDEATRGDCRDFLDAVGGQRFVNTVVPALRREGNRLYPA